MNVAPASIVTAAAPAALPPVWPAVPMRKGVMGFVTRNPSISLGGLLLSVMVLCALFAPWLGTVDPTAIATAKRTRPPGAEFWFGSDMLGRDIYSRVIYGTRVSVLVGFSVAVLASITGLLLGLTSGFVRWADGAIMRFMDGMMSIPPILLAVALMALTRGSVGNVITAIAIAEFPRVARLVRGVVVRLGAGPS